MHTRSASPSASASRLLVAIAATAVLTLAIAPSVAAADEALPVAEIQHEGPVDFETEILPLLRRNCIACHNATEAESDLVLESPQTMLAGGIEGPGIVPGNADESLVFRLAAHRQESFMPPADNAVGAKDFTPEELGLIQLWINQGATGGTGGGPAPIVWQPLPPGVNPIYAVAVSPHGRLVAAGRASQISLYSVPSQQELGRLTDPELIEIGLYDKPGVAHRDAVQSLAFSPNGRRLASGGFRTVKIWHRDDSVQHAELPAPDADVRSMAVSSDGARAALALADGRVQIFEIASRTQLLSLAGPPGGLTSVAFSPDGIRLVGGAIDGTVQIWNLEDGQIAGQIQSPAAVTAVAVLSEGGQIVTGGADSIIRLWDLAAVPAPAAPPEQPAGGVPGPVREMAGHTAPITGFALVPNQPTAVVSASLDGTARQWDTAAGTQTRQFAHGAPLVSVALRADGKRLATAAETGTTKLWNAEDGQQIAELTSDSDSPIVVADLQRRIELARRHVQNAKADLDAAVQRQLAESANADKAAVEVVRAELAAKQKAEAAVKPVADKEAAEQELAALKSQLETAKAAEPPAADAAEEAKAQAAQQLAELTEKVTAAEKKLADLTPPAQKAMEEKQAAEEAAVTAKRSVETAKEAVQRTAAEVPRLKGLMAERQQEQQTAEDQLTQTQQDLASLKTRISELEAQKAETDRMVLDARNQLRTAEAARQAAAAAAVAADAVAIASTDAAAQAALQQARGQSEAADNAWGGKQAVADAVAAAHAQLEKQLLEATQRAAAADEAAKAAQSAIVEMLTSRQPDSARRVAEAAEQAQAAATVQTQAAQSLTEASNALAAAVASVRQVASEAQQATLAATRAKTNAEQAVAEADAHDKASTALKKAADAALTAAQETLSKAADEPAKAVATIEVEIATRNKTAADQQAADATAALQSASAAKTAAEQALAETQTKFQQLQETANQSLAQAKAAYADARGKLAQADAAVGGYVAQAATAVRLKTAADAALAELRNPARAVAFSPDGAQMAVAGDRGQIAFYSGESGAPLHQLNRPATTAAPEGTPQPAAGFVAAAYLGGDRLLAAAADRSLAVWATLPQWSLERKIGSADSPDSFVNRVTAVEFSPDGQWLATGGGEPSRSGELKLWNPDTGELVREIHDAHSDTVFDVAFSEDGKYLATCGADRFMKVFETETGNLVKSFEGHTHHVLGVAWRADGRLLVTSGADNVIKVWDFSTGEGVRSIPGFKKELTAIDFLGVSDNFVVSAGDNQVVTRNTGGGAGPGFAGATDFMYSVRATEDGNLVVAGGQDSVLRVWDPQGKSLATFAPASEN